MRRRLTLMTSTLVLLALAPPAMAQDQLVKAVPVTAAPQSPTLKLNHLNIDGPLAQDAARRAVDKSLPALEKCYAARAKKGASPAGVVSLRLLVGENGKVAGATVERPASSHDELRRCLQNKGLDIRFPRAGGHTTVRLDLRYAPNHARLFGTRGNSSGTAIGGLGIKSVGRGGSGSKRPSSATPTISSAAPLIMGSLSKNQIQQVIRRNIAKVRYCYERELARTPALAGRVTTRFIINPAGAVSSASIQSTTLNNTTVEACVTKMLQSFHFPHPPGGGVVIVTYPFVFRSAP